MKFEYPHHFNHIRLRGRIGRPRRAIAGIDPGFDAGRDTGPNLAPRDERLIMRRLGWLVLIPVLVIAAAVTVAQLHRPGLSRLRIVLAGDPGTPQTESFRKLLAQHVRSVRIVPVLDLAKANLSAADVLIVTGETMKIAKGDFHMRPAPTGITLESLPIPTVLVGGMGARVADDLDLKLGWRHG